jgi:hypothetical protein
MARAGIPRMSGRRAASFHPSPFGFAQGDYWDIELMVSLSNHHCSRVTAFIHV